MADRSSSSVGAPESARGVDVRQEALDLTVARILGAVETFAAERDSDLRLTPEASAQVTAFSTTLRSLPGIVSELSTEALSSLSRVLRNLGAALDHVVSLRDDVAVGAILDAYQLTLAPYVLLANVQIHIRDTVVEANARLQGAAQEIGDDINASIVQTIRVAKEERRRLEGEAERLSKDLLDSLRAGGESVITSIRTDVSEQVLLNSQVEFAAASKRASRDVTLWAVVTSAVLVGFIAFGWYLLKTQEAMFIAHPDWTWQFIYIGGLRVALLGALAALGSFALRMLKRHIQIKHVVAHKCRILKSVPGLLVASPLDNRYSTLQAFIAALLSEKELSLDDDNPESLGVSMPRLPKTTKPREGAT